MNDSDSLLISQFYLTTAAKKLEPIELLAVIAACIVDGKDDNSITLNDIKVPKSVKDSLLEINDIWDSLRRIERSQKSVESDWKMSVSWLGPLWDWMQGEAVSTICSNYGIYEGNLIRSVLKLQNMLDEWRSMATFCEHTDILEKFKDAHRLLVREAVIQDSLYLHL